MDASKKVRQEQYYLILTTILALLAAWAWQDVLVYLFRKYGVTDSIIVKIVYALIITGIGLFLILRVF